MGEFSKHEIFDSLAADEAPSTRWMFTTSERLDRSERFVPIERFSPIERFVPTITALRECYALVLPSGKMSLICLFAY